MKIVVLPYTTCLSAGDEESLVVRTIDACVIVNHQHSHVDPVQGHEQHNQPQPTAAESCVQIRQKQAHVSSDLELSKSGIKQPQTIDIQMISSS